LDAIHDLPCVACEMDHSGFATLMRTEAHHLVDRGNRAASGGHQATIPLCGWHHRGEPPRMDMSAAQAETIYGPSLARSKRDFVKRYGTERELLAKVDRRLAGY
jgi:hypothetical protein